MNLIKDLDDPRRRWLIQALSAGLFSTGLASSGSALAQSVFGNRPGKLPPGKSIYRLSGEVSVNGKPATIETVIMPGDTVKTGPGGEIIFVVNSQSMILRGDSHLVIEAAKNSETSLVVKGLRILTGKLLSVSRDTPMSVETTAATIGIRGTGFYVEADAEQTYFCTCYGLTKVQSIADPNNQAEVLATHHDRPLYIASKASPGQHIRNAPFVNHTDQELALIEALVGRTTPFVFSHDAYAAPRRSY